jgi:hypothetical protein
MKKLRIGGVPEHFNMPWHYAASQGLFLQSEIDLVWNDFPGGTGAMASALKNGELDMAIMLTEGAILDIHLGAANKILGFYVKSPLLWGIHVAHHSVIESEVDIFEKKYAISRKGSGSHLMAMIHANFNGFSLKDTQFELVNNLNGALESIGKNESEIFFWEKFMTQKYVDSSNFKRIGVFPTPWPCFVLVVKNNFLVENKELIEKVKTIMENVLLSFKALPEVPFLISEKYQLHQNQVEEWLKTVEWVEKIEIQEEMISNVKSMLTKSGLIV